MPKVKSVHHFESGGEKLVLLERRNDIAIVTLNRPNKGNMITRPMHREFEDVTHQLIYDRDVRAVIVTGAGRDFCAGPELEHLLERCETGYNTAAVCKELTRSAMRLAENMLNIRAPIISAVNGRAHSLGATIALLGDVVFAANNAEFRDDHVVQGNVAGDGGACMWPLLIGPARAKQYLMTGDALTAKEAERIGLINRVVPAAKLMPEALAFAERLAAGPPLAIQWTKLAVNKYIKFVLHEVGDLGIAWEFHTIRSEDHLTAMRAIVNKTPPPRFKGV